MLEENVFTSSEGVRLKPDLVLQAHDRVVIVDVAVKWDCNERILKQKCSEKAQEYSVLASLFPGRHVAFQGLVFGARSMLCRESMVAGAALGPLPRDLGWLSASDLRGSLIVFQRFNKRALGRAEGCRQ